MSKTNGGYKFIGKGLTQGEIRTARKRFQDYLDTYPHLHKMTYYGLLEDLIFHEYMNDRIKQKVEELSKARKELDESAAIGSKTQKELDANMETQFKLKEKLGLFEDKSTLDAYKDFEELREDFKEFRRRNPNQFKVTCPSCAFIFFLKRRTDQYEELEAPWFKDKVLCNPELWKLYKEKKITAEDVANVLGTSVDYIGWLQEKIFIESKGENKK